MESPRGPNPEDGIEAQGHQQRGDGMEKKMKVNTEAWNCRRKRGQNRYLSMYQEYSFSSFYFIPLSFILPHMNPNTQLKLLVESKPPTLVLYIHCRSSIESFVILMILGAAALGVGPAGVYVCIPYSLHKTPQKGWCIGGDEAPAVRACLRNPRKTWNRQRK
jgi:hypothetical protein